MRRGVRLAVMWLLALALPLQGLSAATMAACADGHHERAASHGVAHTHHHDATAALADEHVGGASLHSHAGADHTHAAKTGFGTDVSHKCSACASCCTSAGVPSEAMAFEPVKLTEHFAPFAVRSVPAFLSGGLERPPRAIFA